MTTLFRAMRETPQGSPQVGPTGRTLGVRPGIDIRAIKPHERVVQGEGGMSVSPHDPCNLPEHRRPSAFLGFGRDPVWRIEEHQLPSTLAYRPDPRNANHGFVEPAGSMTLQEYQQAIASTQPNWVLIHTWPDQGADANASR